MPDLYWWHGAIMREMDRLAEGGYGEIGLDLLVDNMRYVSQFIGPDTKRWINELAEAGDLVVIDGMVRLP